MSILDVDKLEEQLTLENIPVGILKLRKPVPVMSYSRIGKSDFYNSEFFEMGLFYKPVSNLTKRFVGDE